MIIDLNFELGNLGTIPLGKALAEAVELGFTRFLNSNWPVRLDDCDFSQASLIVEGKDHRYANFNRQNSIAYVYAGYGKTDVWVAAKTKQYAEEHMAIMHDFFPVSETPRSGTIPVTFWSLSPQGGAHSIARDLTVPEWDEIKANYPTQTSEDLDRIIIPDYVPGRGGQLHLWYGEPGTGKTTALRALGDCWRSWCSLHYITDPEMFFGGSANYMLSVLMDEDEFLPQWEEDSDPRGKWRLLILEDTGELIQRDAKSVTSQGFSRLLNSVDGLIGQGLRFMVLITTNEEVGSMHDAIARPGRTASKIEFTKFDSSAAQKWLESRDHYTPNGSVGPLTLAELYAKIEKFDNQPRERKVGFGI